MSWFQACETQNEGTHKDRDGTELRDSPVVAIDLYPPVQKYPALN